MAEPLVALVVHQLHQAKGTTAHHRLHIEVRHLDLQVLQHHSVLQLLAEGPDDVLKQPFHHLF